MALKSLAVLIKNYGPKYWPIFDRIDKELTQLDARKRRLKIALDT